MTYVIVNDFLNNRIIKLLMDDSEFDRVDSIWNNTQEDSLLKDLQHFDLFKGRLHISDLEPFHFRLMIARNVYKMSDLLKNEETLDLDNPIVSSLIFLICSLIKSIEIRIHSKIETMKITRFAENDVTIDFSGNMSLEIPVSKKEKDKTPGLTVVIDNDNN